MWSMKMVVKYFLFWHLGFEDEVKRENTDKSVLHNTTPTTERYLVLFQATDFFYFFLLALRLVTVASMNLNATGFENLGVTVFCILYLNRRPKKDHTTNNRTLVLPKVVVCTYIWFFEYN